MDFDAEQDLQIQQRVPCQYCGRKFAAESVGRHSQICKKTSKKRAVFDSSKQRDVVENGIKAKVNQQSTSKLRKTFGNQGTKSTWRQKHEEFINTVRSAREATAAIKEGRKPPPLAPAALNPDYVQCPHCSRRFNENAADRHIPFCAEQHKRLSNKKNVTPTSGVAAQAAARAAARLTYRPPSLKSSGGFRKSDGIEASRSAPPRTIHARMNTSPSAGNVRFTKEHTKNQYASPSFSNGRNKSVMRNGSARVRKQPNPDWDSTIESSSYNVVARSKTGLKPVSNVAPEISRTNAHSTSPHSSQSGSKPIVRKLAGKDGKVVKTSGKRLPDKALREWSSDSLRSDSDSGDNMYNKYAYQFTSPDKFGGKQHQTTADNSGKYGAYRGDYAHNTYTKKSLHNILNGEPSDWLQTGPSDQKYSSVSTTDPSFHSQLSRFCHECGARYPIANAKFCCDCGVKRLLLS